MAELNYPDLMQEVIASALTDYTQVEVVRLSYSTYPEDLNITYQLEDGTTLTDSTGPYVVRSVPLRISDESQDELVSNTRTLTIQGINDVVATYDDLTIPENEEKIKCEIFSYLLDRKGVISSVQSKFTYYVLDISYSQKSNSATLAISTNPTNRSETGVKSTSSLFPSLRGVE